MCFKKTFITSLLIVVQIITAQASNPWPNIVRASDQSSSVNLVVSQPSQKHWVYESKSFQFLSNEPIPAPLLKKVAQSFESTKKVINELPWSLSMVDAQPRYQAKLYMTRRQYILDGGSSSAKSSYHSKHRIIRVPFESLGLSWKDRQWHLDDARAHSTLAHEVTHQMMHEYLHFMPMWLVEGCAEYIELLPYRDGAYYHHEHERGMINYLLKFKKDHNIHLTNVGSFTETMHLARREWRHDSNHNLRAKKELYFKSALLVYYFSHLQSQTQGNAFVNMMKQFSRANRQWEDFLASPEVTKTRTGAYRFSKAVRVPQMQPSETFGLRIQNALIGKSSAEDLDRKIHLAYTQLLKRYGL